MNPCLLDGTGFDRHAEPLHDRCTARTKTLLAIPFLPIRFDGMFYFIWIFFAGHVWNIYTDHRQLSGICRNSDKVLWRSRRKIANIQLFFFKNPELNIFREGLRKSNTAKSANCEFGSAEKCPNSVAFGTAENQPRRVCCMIRAREP